MAAGTTSTNAVIFAHALRRIVAAPRRGFTLAESLVASVVLAIAVVGIAGTLTSTYQSIAAGAGTNEAVAMARQLIEEIAAKPFAVPSAATDNPGYAAGALVRSSYDSLDDYDGFTDTSPSIKKLDGATVSAGSGGVFTRSVMITPGVRPTGHPAPAADFALVTITVTKPNGETVKLSKLIARSEIVR